MWEIEKLHADHKQVYVHVATASYRYLYLLDPSIDIPSHAPNVFVYCPCFAISLPPSFSRSPFVMCTRQMAHLWHARSTNYRPQHSPILAPARRPLIRWMLDNQSQPSLSRFLFRSAGWHPLIYAGKPTCSETRR